MISHDGEDIASKGRILIFQIKKSKKRTLSKGDKLPSLVLALKSEKEMALGPVTSLSSLKSEDIHRVVVGAGAEVTVEQWGNGKLTQVGEYSQCQSRTLHPRHDIVKYCMALACLYLSRLLSCTYAGSRNSALQNILSSE